MDVLNSCLLLIQSHASGGEGRVAAAAMGPEESGYTIRSGMALFRVGE